MTRITLRYALLAVCCLTASAAATAAEPPPELARWLAPQEWVRDTDGPLISLGKAGDFDDMHLFAPAVVLENGKFSMWYSGSRGSASARVFRLGLATSDDGKLFQKFDANPVLEFKDGAHSILTPGPLRKPDGSVLREDGKLRMWFASATLGKGGLHTLHESTSTDGIHWAEPSPALLENVYCPTVLKTDKGYQMWFSDVSRRPWIYRHASSADGTKWNVTPQPVLQLSQPWEAEVLVYPTVLKVDDAYLMWYGSYDNAVRRETTAIGFAASLDGLHWFKHPQNPVIRPDPARIWESNYVGSGCVIRLPDGSFRYWYASRTKPPFEHLYFAINTARWAGPVGTKASTGDAANLPAPVAEYVKRCEQAHAAQIESKETALKLLTAKRAKNEATPAEIATAERELAALRKRSAPLLPLPLPTEKDAVGIFVPAAAGDDRQGHSVDVLEIIDGTNVVVRAWYQPTAAPAERTVPGEATFVDLWIHGADTRGMTVGAPAQLLHVFHVTGSKSFNTTCGGRSVPLLERVDVEGSRAAAR